LHFDHTRRGGGVSRRGCPPPLDRPRRSHYATSFRTLRDTAMKRLPLLCELLLAAAGAVALALAGCSSSPPADYKIGVVPKGLTHEFWQSIHRGADRAAADLKQEEGLTVEIVWDGPSKESDALDQINIVRNLRNQGIHGLVLAPQDSKQMVPSVQQCVDQK